MMRPKILVFAGSIRTGSYNVRLAALATKLLAFEEAEPTRISLQDFPLPLYDGDIEARSGPPEQAVKLKRMVMQQLGLRTTPQPDDVSDALALALALANIELTERRLGPLVAHAVR